MDDSLVELQQNHTNRFHIQIYSSGAHGKQQEKAGHNEPAFFSFAISAVHP
jgi:hypothetical protein